MLRIQLLKDSLEHFIRQVFYIQALGYSGGTTQPAALRSFGPLFIGAISDIFFVNEIIELGVTAEELARNQCHPRVIAELSEPLQNVCGAVYADSLRSAMLITARL